MIGWIQRSGSFAWRGRVVGWALLGILVCVGAVEAQQRPRLDMELPAYPVDAAACKRFLAGGPTTINVDPYKVKGIAQEPGMRISGSLFPDSPGFRFYADNFERLEASPVAFAPSMRCFLNADQGKDGMIHFENVPDGIYIGFLTTTKTVTYSGTSTGTAVGLSPLGPVTVLTNTPYSGQYEQRITYGSLVTVKNGTVSAGDAVQLTGLRK
jgi:hypothetical protein